MAWTALAPAAAVAATSARRFISPISRTSGFVLCNFARRSPSPHACQLMVHPSRHRRLQPVTAGPTYRTRSIGDAGSPAWSRASAAAASTAGGPRAIAIADAAKRLNELRENWLNPEDLVERVPEVVPGYPDRILPKDDKAAAVLKKRTLTNLYNERPAWLDHAHEALDEAVAAAYGWPADLTDEKILERLFHLNQERAKRLSEVAS